MKGNRIVLLLPVSVMIGLFIFGYISLSQTETVSNEDLKNSMSITEKVIDKQTLQIQWQWGDFPEEGIQGDDFLEVLLPMELQDEILDINISLTQGDEVVYENDEFVLSEKGLLIAFPNEIQDEQILGPSGVVTVNFSDAVIENWQGSVRYYHTWYDHDVEIESGMNIENTLVNDLVQSYWVVDS